MKRLSVSILVGSLVTASFAIVPNNGPDSTYSFVGQIGGASGVAFMSRSVITAKHVGGTSFVMGGTTYNAFERIDHPTLDVAILNFSSDLPGWHNLGNSSPIGSTLTMVGFGNTGVLNGAGNGYDNTFGAGVRRAGNNTLAFKQFVPDYGPSLLAWLTGDGDAAYAIGDSGGGTFINGELVGVNSFIFNESGDPPTLPNYGFASQNGGVPYFGSGAIDLTDPTMRAWVTANAVPEPTTMALLAMGIAAAARRKRK